MKSYLLIVSFIFFSSQVILNWFVTKYSFNNENNIIAPVNDNISRDNLFGVQVSKNLNTSKFYKSPTDTSQWNGFGPGLDGPNCEMVHDIAIDGNEFYVVGSFTNAGGNPDADFIARWDGYNWHAVGSGLNNDAYRIIISKSDIYVAGQFTDAGGNPDADYIARWNGKTWHSLGAAFDNSPSINAIAINRNDVYIGGLFTDAGGNQDADNVARWDGNTWHSLGTGLNNLVESITIFKNDVYVGGWFTKIGGNEEANYFARWDGTDWHAYPGNFYYVYDMLVFDCDDIYVTGSNLLLKWDGNEWNDLGSVMADNGYTLAECRRNIYVGSYNRLYKWDQCSEEWSLYPVLEGTIWDIETDYNDVYVGGHFYNAGSNSSADHVARWGKPENVLVISGVPNFVCQHDPPIFLPLDQNGITGNWSGEGVANNTFNPAGLDGLKALTFTPDQGQTFVHPVTTYISIFWLDSIFNYFLPTTICESSQPNGLPSYTCPPGIWGYWSGPGVINGYFDPSGLNGAVSLSFNIDFTIDYTMSGGFQPPNIGQCTSAPTTTIDVINLKPSNLEINCFDNNTSNDTTDDLIIILLTPDGQYSNNYYSVSVSSGSITPSSGNYNGTTGFQMQPGSAGAGNVILTVTDNSGSECVFDFLISDPGICSDFMTATNTEPDHFAKFYPNPVNKLLYIDNITSITRYSVFDLNGIRVMDQRITNQYIDIEQLAPGAYLLRLEDKSGVVIKKFIKQ